MIKLDPITVFTWGYWGWGTSVPQLIQAIDAIEHKRGFMPPLLVDIRLSRKVRAPGFCDNALREFLGDDRYLWLQGLGNEAILDPVPGKIRIRCPKDVAKLLQAIDDSHGRRRRVIFFCSCKSPPVTRPRCHRFTIARLLLRHARVQGVPVEIVEWPGAEPHCIQLTAPKSAIPPLLRSSPPKHIPLPRSLGFSEAAAQPYGSVITLAARNSSGAHIVTGPATFVDKRWQIPVYEVVHGNFHVSEAVRQANRLLRKWNLSSSADRPNCLEVSHSVDSLEQCVYTILHPEKLKEFAHRAGEGDLTESKQWVTAKRLLAEAKRTQKRLIIVFADATQCSRLIFWARAREIRITKAGTTCLFDTLTEFRPIRSQQELYLVSKRRRIEPGFIKPYAICFTPRLPPDLATR